MAGVPPIRGIDKHDVGDMHRNLRHKRACRLSITRRHSAATLTEACRKNNEYEQRREKQKGDRREKRKEIYCERKVIT